MVYILLAEGFEEAEALIPADLLRRAGLPVSLVGLNAATVAGGHGIAVAADLTLEQVVLSYQDMLLLPGGKGGVESMQMDLFALALIQKAHTVGCYLAAICAAPTLLAHLGLLDRRSAVCYPGMEGEMGSAVVRPECPVVVDGRIITARSAGCAFDFALKLIEILARAENAKEVQHAIHDRGTEEGPADWHFFPLLGHRRPGAGHRLSGRLADQAGEDGLSPPGSPRLRDGVPGLPPGAAHGHLRLRHPGAHGAGPSNPP